MMQRASIKDAHILAILFLSSYGLHITFNDVQPLASFVVAASATTADDEPNSSNGRPIATRRRRRNNTAPRLLRSSSSSQVASERALRKDEPPSHCEGYNPSSCGCESTRQAEYRGTISATVSGYTCQYWDDGDYYTAERHPDSGLGGNNYCRNPSDDERAWCYVNKNEVRWEYCNVPTCTAPGHEPMLLEGSKVGTAYHALLEDQPLVAHVLTNSEGSMPTTTATCATPELASLARVTSDLRDTYQNGALPSINDGITITNTAKSIVQNSVLGNIVQNSFINNLQQPVSTTTTCQTDLSKKKVLLIGIDGLRSDVAAMTPLPNLRRIQSMGSYSYWANVQTTQMAVSGPGWASMFTGVEANRHGVGGNFDLRDVSHPTVFKQVKDTFGLKIAASVVWEPLIGNIIDHEDSTTLEDRFVADDDVSMTNKAEEWILNEEHDFVFVAFDGVDAQGHSTGFEGYDARYQTRVRETDVLLGRLLDAVLSTSEGEEWLIVLTTDHGGKGRFHGGQDSYNRKIPMMVASNSPRVDIGERPFHDPGSHMDVLPTIMHFLGGEEEVPDGLDGKVFGFNDYTRQV